MVVGVDIAHPMTPDPKLPTTGAMVGSRDKFCMKYFSSIVQLGHRE